MNELKEKDEIKINNGNVTNVVNTTVNNITSTEACISYMWENEKGIILLFIALLVVATLSICLSLVNLVKRSNYKNMDEELNQMKRQVEELQMELENNNEAISLYNENITKAIENSEKSLNEVKKQDEKIEKIEAKMKIGAVIGNDKNKTQDNTVAAVDINENGIEQLYNRKMVSSISAEYQKTAMNTLGDTLNDVLYIKGRGDAHVTYYLGGKYSKFKGNFSCPDVNNITEGEYPLEIYADKDPSKDLFTMSFGRNTAITPVEIDVTGVEFLTIRVSKNSILYDTVGLILSDGYLE